jgi:transcriptional antiterminator
MSDSIEKMTLKKLADELGVSKNTVRNQLVNSGFDLAQYKKKCSGQLTEIYVFGFWGFKNEKKGAIFAPLLYVKNLLYLFYP